MKTILRAAAVAAIAAAVTFGLAHGVKAAPSHVERNGTMIACELAATDLEVETCAGE